MKTTHCMQMRETRQLSHEQNTLGYCSERRWTPEEHPTYLGARLAVEEEEGGRMQEGQKREGREATTRQKRKERRNKTLEFSETKQKTTGKCQVRN